MNPTPKIPINNEVDRNALAQERTQLAAERTFLSWIRTGLGACSQIHNAYIQDYFSCALQWNFGGHIKSIWPPKFHLNARGKNLNLGN